MKKTKVIRVHRDFDLFLDNYQKNISESLGRKISKPDASRILANSGKRNIIIINKRKRKDFNDFTFF